jgi:hypothetical protein
MHFQLKLQLLPAKVAKSLPTTHLLKHDLIVKRHSTAYGHHISTTPPRDVRHTHQEDSVLGQARPPQARPGRRLIATKSASTT